MGCYDVLNIFVVLVLQIPYITAALLETKLGAEGRKDLFDWLTKQLSGLNDFADAVHLLKPAGSAMAVGLPAPARYLFPHYQLFHL